MVRSPSLKVRIDGSCSRESGSHARPEQVIAREDGRSHGRIGSLEVAGGSERQRRLARLRTGDNVQQDALEGAEDAREVQRCSDRRANPVRRRGVSGPAKDAVETDESASITLQFEKQSSLQERNRDEWSCEQRQLERKLLRELPVVLHLARDEVVLHVEQVCCSAILRVSPAVLARSETPSFEFASNFRSEFRCLPSRVKAPVTTNPRNGSCDTPRFIP